MTSPIVRMVEQVLDRGDFAKCPTPHKLAHPSRASAKRHLRLMAGLGDRGMRLYRCPGGHYHVGHPRWSK